jgi:hypothetical protein
MGSGCVLSPSIFVVFLQEENEFIAKCFITVPPPNSEESDDKNKRF